MYIFILSLKLFPLGLFSDIETRKYRVINEQVVLLSLGICVL